MMSSHLHPIVASSTSLTRWYACLGHPNKQVLSRVCNSSSKSISCKSCLVGKSHQLPFEYVSHRASFPLVVIHYDVWTSPILSNSDFKYFMLFVDDYFWFTWVFLMKNKSEVPTHFHRFRCFIENLCNAKIKFLQTNGRGEYTNNAFQTYLRENGIIQRFFLSTNSISKWCIRTQNQTLS